MNYDNERLNDCKGSWDLSLFCFCFSVWCFCFVLFCFLGGARYFTKALISQYLK